MIDVPAIFHRQLFPISVSDLAEGDRVGRERWKADEQLREQIPDQRNRRGLDAEILGATAEVSIFRFVREHKLPFKPCRATGPLDHSPDLVGIGELEGWRIEIKSHQYRAKLLLVSVRNHQAGGPKGKNVSHYLHAVEREQYFETYLVSYEDVGRWDKIGPTAKLNLNYKLEVSIARGLWPISVKTEMIAVDAWREGYQLDLAPGVARVRGDWRVYLPTVDFDDCWHCKDSKHGRGFCPEGGGCCGELRLAEGGWAQDRIQCRSCLGSGRLCWAPSGDADPPPLALGAK